MNFAHIAAWQLFSLIVDSSFMFHVHGIMDELIELRAKSISFYTLECHVVILINARRWNTLTPKKAKST